MCVKPVITCPNPNCQTPNPANILVCPACQTAIPHRYLWAVGKWEGGSPGALGDRYHHVASQIFLDTQPGVQPKQPTDIPSSWTPYLRL